jgi:hypothetical protein
MTARQRDEPLSSNDLMGEFIQALTEEIEAIKAGKGGSVTRILDGRFVRADGGIFVYSFTLENFIATIDDSPAEVEVGGSRYHGQIIQTQGLEVIVGVEHDFGPSIAEARLITNLYFLHEILKKKFEAVRAGDGSADFSLAGRVFEGRISPSPKTTELPPLEPHPTMPNPSQLAALETSQAQQTTLVWGPPGTGKTETLARIVECFIKQGMRVLVVAHANAAVDEATEDIAAILKATGYYNDGKIIRLGNAQKQSLRDEYNLVLLDGIAERLAGTLKQEGEELEQRSLSIERVLVQLASAAEAIRERATLAGQITQLANAVPSSKQQTSQLSRQAAERQNDLAALRGKLERAESLGRVRRFLLALDPARIRREIYRVSAHIDSLHRQLSERQSQYQQMEQQLGETRGRLTTIEERLHTLLGQTQLSERELLAREKELGAEKDKITARKADVQKELDEIQRRVLSEAMVVCTTLTKAFTAKELPDVPFDVLVVDEASMAPMPHLYWALGRCRRATVIVGDFLQLPPICVADGEMAQKWLGRSIYELLGVPVEANRAKQDSRISLLDRQYRMHPDISKVANNLFYDNLLKDDPSVHGHILSDGLSDSALTVIDTSVASPWCSRLSTGGRFNIYNALLAARTAARVIDGTAPDTPRIGIITPYAAQARLIRKIIEDMRLEISPDSVSTVHKFQGGERDVIVLDTAEGPGVRIAPMLSETKADSDAPLLLNVAITRAKCKIFLIANLNYLKRELYPSTALYKIIQAFENDGQRINCTEIVDSYFTRDFEKWVAKFIDLAQGQAMEPPDGSLFSEQSFYPVFLEDLRNAKEEIIILSPFVSIKRSGQFMELFRALVHRGVKIRAYTRPPRGQVNDFALNAAEVIEQMRAIGAEVIERWRMHQKVAIIDRKIAWEGSLNILSHRDSGEQMRRLPFDKAVNELVRLCQVDESSGVDTRGAREPVRTVELCPECGKHEMVIRISRYGAFLSCPDRQCPGKRGVNKWARITTHTLCPETGHAMILRVGVRGPFLGCSDYPNCKKTLGIR